MTKWRSQKKLWKGIGLKFDNWGCNQVYLDTESRKHYGRTVINRRKVGKTIEIWRKVCQNRDLEEVLDKYFNNKN